MPRKGCSLVTQPIVRLGGAAIDDYLQVAYGVSNSLRSVPRPHDQRASVRRNELYGLSGRRSVCAVYQGSLLTTTCPDARCGSPLGSWMTHGATASFQVP